jgi:hypothetical protein
MPTTRFCALIGVPERSWRRHQARARQGREPKGPWPQSARDRVREAARRQALERPMTDSARALSKLSPTEPIESTAPASARRLPYRMAQY